MVGVAVITGDHNVTDVRYRKVPAAAESVDIRAGLAALRVLLGGLDTRTAEDRQRAGEAESRRGEAGSRQGRDRRGVGAGAALCP